MDKTKFNEIIDFAIEREEEAVTFYRELQDLVDFKGKKELLKGFEDMEKVHVKVLQNLRKRELNQMTIPKVDNLEIASYMVAAEPSKDMSFQDIIAIAMQREEKSQQLYTVLAQQSPDADIKKLFLKLASEEAKHKLQFEKIYDEEVLTEN